ncbi:hypothetical protein AZI85_06150 [Bdellovibrio bacteriovorus]|uniref:DUF2007 domain-containing protein n=1 Tax=Bdellovibrio bacteriovorus TaxID=959 RepID=A0A150WG70_BDEBC|nr:hypothetical protein [Bdellovibrio bacteriovorus]KYG61801.1 hypothetical protein AZI85_06150 [Bdellovibrio bacteriovorus]
MNNSTSNFVFLMDCADFSEAQVVKSFLESQGFHPRVRDEQTRSVAPHLGQLLGKLTLEIPEHEYMEASLELERREPPRIQIVHENDLETTQAMAKKALWNAILGCIFIPLLCNFYSMVLGYRVLRQEVPLTKTSRNRLLWAIVFNSFAFYVWLTIGPKYFFKNY